jgi:hypothetical protein
MQQVLERFLSEVQRLHETIAGMRADLAHVAKRQDDQHALDTRMDAKVDQIDKRLSTLEEAHKGALERKEEGSEWWRWGIGLLVVGATTTFGGLVVWLATHISWK